MCWNERVSLNTYIVAVFGTVFALMNGLPLNVVIWLHTFSLMQLVEYFIWKNLHIPELNQLFSSIGLFVLILEPFTSIFLISDQQLRNSMLFAYSILLLILLSIYYPWRPYTKIAENKHLLWMWFPPIQPPQLYIVYTIWVFFYFIPLFIAKQYILAIFAISTIVISVITYAMTNTAGSMWCWIANITWLFVIGFIAADKCFEDLLCKK